MTAAAYTSDLTDIFLFESTGSVSAYGGGAGGLGASPDYAIEGTNAVDKQIDNAEKGFLYDNTTNFVIGPHDHFFIWVVCAVPGLVNTRDLRGIVVCIGDSTSAFVKFHVNGGDTKPRGGIAPYAIRFVETTLANRRTLVGTPGTTPSWIGGGAFTTGTAKFSNFACDAARIGTGYDVTFGTGVDAAANFAGIATDDESTAEGICQNADGGFSIQGKIRVGNSGTECELTDSNINLFLIDTLDGEALTDFTEFLVSDDLSILTLTNVNFVGLGTNNPGRLENLRPLITAQDETLYDNSPTTEGTFAAGSGYAAADVITMDDGFTLVTVDAVSTGAVTQFTINSTKGRTATAGTVIAQDSVLPTGGTGFTLTPDTDNLIADYGTITCLNVGFVDFGDTILSTNDSLTFGRWIGCGQVTPNGATLNDCTLSGYEGTANTSYIVYDVNADPDGELDNVDITKGTAATHAIEFGLLSPLTMTLRDCNFAGYNALDTQDDSTFHFKRTGGTVTLNLVGCTGEFSFRTDGAAIVIVDNPVTVTVTVADVTTGLPVEGARVYAEASPPSGLSDEYDISEANTWIGMNATNVELGQSITGQGGPLLNVRWHLHKGFTPTVNCQAHVYAHSGVFGVSSVPGALIASSTTVYDTSLLTTSSGSPDAIDFAFDGTDILEDGTNYFITLSWPGDGSNTINAHIDSTSPTHPGNYALDSGSWAADNTRDLAFQVTEGSPLPYQDSISGITRVTTTATATRNGHIYAVGDKVLIEGAVQSEYNGTRTVTAITTNTFDYTVSGSPTTPATGTIVNTFVLFSEDTPASGEVTVTRAFTADQLISGRVRRSSTAPLYKSQPISRVVSRATDTELVVQLLPDE